MKKHASAGLYILIKGSIFEDNQKQSTMEYYPPTNDSTESTDQQSFKHNYFLVPPIASYAFTLAARDAHQQEFRNRYKSLVNICDPASPHFATGIKVKLSDFLTAFNNVIPSIPANDYGAIKLIHRYDTGSNKWHLTVECGTIPKTGVQNHGLESNTFNHAFTPANIQSPDTNRFDIDTSGNISPNSTFMGNFDPDYFGNVKEIKDDGSQVDLLDTDHVNYTVFPWECEVLELCRDNNIDPSNPTAIPDTINMVFEPIVTFAPNLLSTMTPLSNVNWPHITVLYLNDNNGDYLDNSGDTTETGKFQMKGANFSTICPPRCGIYLWTPDLPKV